MDTSVFESYESEVRSYCRHFPTVFTKAKGAYFYDEDGRKYIDFFCGAGAVNYGHNNPEIKQKLIDYLNSDGVMHALDMYTVPKREFIATFEEKVLQPRGLEYKIQFPGPTGTNANEAALKLARKYTGRQNVFAFMGAFHGMTLGSLALTTDKGSRKGAGVPLNNVTFIPAPYMFPELDTIAYMQRLLDDDHSGIEKPAAVFLETIQAEGGIHVFSVEFLQALRAFCTKNEILMVVDDVQVGCCRSGTFFSFERAGIQPDIVTMSKSIGGYGLPLAVTLIKPSIDVWTPGEHNGTFRGNQLAFVAAKGGLEYMLSHKVEEQVQKKSALIKEFLEKEVISQDSRLQLRGIGMIWGVEFENIPIVGLADRVIEQCFSHGLIIEGAGRKNSVVKLMPPLVISEEDLLAGMQIIKQSVQEVLATI
ncbi:MAG: diaminobutyrate--2-oxoglutarate transaminase [Clostridia bacterium]|nr:diaminobutyrate--2-oxoglutarate transaminase [Clostridia bacterium]HCA54083.1 diaminobutyrate--2-oxoglutarate transaminase [Oscillospiraceae bacterium]